MSQKFKFLVQVLLATVLVVISGNERSNASGSGVMPFSLHSETTPSGYKSLDNPTLTCAGRSITASDVTPYSTTVNAIVKGFRITPLSALSTFLNCFVIYLVARHKRLQALSFGIALIYRLRQ